MFSLDCQLTFKHQRWYNLWAMKFNIVAQNWQVVWIQNSLLNPPLYSVYCTLENLDHLTGRISCRTSINLEIAKFNCHFRDLFYNLDLLKIISISCLVGVQVFESSYVRPRTGSLKGNCIMITHGIFQMINILDVNFICLLLLIGSLICSVYFWYFILELDMISNVPLLYSVYVLFSCHGTLSLWWLRVNILFGTNF